MYCNILCTFLSEAILHQITVSAIYLLFHFVVTGCLGAYNRDNTCEVVLRYVD